MKLTTFVLRLHNTNDDTYAVAAMDLPTDTTLEEATEAAITELDEDLILERITNADTEETATLQTITRVAI